MMKPSRFFRQATMVLGATVLMVSFQNCGKVGAPGMNSSSSLGGGTGVVVGTTASYSQLTYDPNLENSRPQKTGAQTVALDLDLDQGTIVYRSATMKTCRLDVEREQKIKEIISIGRICHPEQPAAGTVSCMAVSLADIKLANASDSVLLRKTVCSSGTYLCDGVDETLRTLLQDLISNPVTDSCQ